MKSKYTLSLIFTFSCQNVSIEKNIPMRVKKVYTTKQPGDVLKTQSNNQVEKKLFKFKFETDIEKGIKKFINWFLLVYEKK